MSWTPSIVLDLIEGVKAHPCLYDLNESNYKNKLMRQTAFAIIAANICEKRPETSLDDVKKKWNIIRSTYLNERKKVQESRKSGVEVFHPSLYYFKEMNFIDSFIQPRASVSTSTLNTLTTFNDSGENGWENYVVSPEVVGDEAESKEIESAAVLEPESIPEILCPPSRKRKRGGDNETDISGVLSAVLLNIAQKATKEDPLTVYCKHLYHSLKELPEDLRAEVQNKIDNLLFDAKRRRGFPINK